MYVNIFATINTGNTTFSYVHDLRTQIDSVGGCLNKQNIVVSPVFKKSEIRITITFTKYVLCVRRILMLISISTTYIFMYYNIFNFLFVYFPQCKCSCLNPRFAICWQYCWSNMDKRPFAHKPNVIVKSSFHILVIVSLVVASFLFPPHIDCYITVTVLAC